MPTIGSPTDAAFTEVLQLGIDTEGFSQQMDQVVAIYTAAIAKMPDMDKVGGVAFSDSINKLNETIKQLAEGAGEALGEISTTMTETADIIETQMGAAAAAVQESQAKIVEALSAISESSRKTRESTGGLGDFFAGLSDNIAKSAGGILKSVLIFNTINEVLRVTGEVIMAPFKAISEGFTYLQNVQDRASEVKAALLQSVSYSADWGTNVKIAGEQADLLVRKVDDLATKLKVSSQSVQTGFTSFLEYGGRNLTGSVDDALKVSGIVTGALQTQTPNIESRKLISEMQKLAQGAAGDSDKLAASLGLSKDQLAQMVAHAQKYHDLYQEILAFAPGIADRISDANDRQSSLVATLELYKERWEALIAGPLFQEFTKILQDILAWVDKNGEKLNDIGINLGLALGNAAQKAEQFLSGNWKGLSSDLVTVAATFGLIAVAIADIGNHLVAIWNQVPDFLKKTGDRGKSTGDRDFANFAQNAAYGDASNARDQGQLLSIAAAARNRANQEDKSSNAAGDREHQSSQTEKNLDQLFDKMTSSLAKLASGDTSGFDFLTQHHDAASSTLAPDSALDNLHPKAPKADNSALKAAQQELRDEITKTKNAYQDERDTVADALAKNTINHQDAANQIRGLYTQEISEINDTIDAYQKQAKASGAKPEQIKAAVAAMQNERDTLQGQASKAINAAQRAADAESEAIAKAHFNALMTLELEYQKESLEQTKQAAADGYITQTQAFDQETAVFDKEYALRRAALQAEIDSMATGTKAREADVDKLTLMDAQYTAQVELRADQRIDIARKEQQATFQHQQNMGQDAISRQGIINAGSDETATAKTGAARSQLALETQLTNAAIANTLALLEEAKAKDINSEASQRLQEQLSKLQNTQLQQFTERVKQAGASAGSNTGLASVQQRASADQQVAQVQAQADALAKTIADLTAKLQADSLTNNSGDQLDDAAKLDTFNTQLDAVNKNLAAMKAITDTLGPSFQKVGDSLENSLLGPNFQSQWDKTTKAFDNADDATDKLTAGFGVAATGLSALDNIGKTITGIINQYETGRKQGGVLGGVGSLLSSGPVSDALSSIPIVGSIVKPLGDAFSFIGDMFVAQAKKIADNINKAVTAIEQQASVGAITLGQEIQQLQQQRQDAITQLSGQKGGKDQLNQLLPQLDQEIAQLQQQAAETMKSFQDSVTVLSAGGTELQNWTKTWMDINKEVQDYLAAGGDIATANKFLNDQLAAQTQDVLDNLNSGEQQAIQDALSLNQLLQQRIDLVKQEQETEFGITTQNAIEKRTSTGVQVASQLSQQQQNYNEQLEDLNNQINLAQQKVALESQVFNIASDTATLQQESNALTIASLKEQLSTYQQMQQIIQSTAGLSFTGSQFNPSIPGTGNTGATAVSGVLAPLNITVNVNAGTQDVNSQQFATYVGNAIQSQVAANRTSL